MSDEDKKQENATDQASDDPRNPANLDKPFKERLAELVGIYGCPLEELFRIAMDLDEEPSTRLNALKEISSYAYPKRKAIEITGPEGGPLESRIDLSNLNDKELAMLDKLTQKATI